MCANYHPVTAQDRLLTFFGVERPKDEVPPETWPGYFAPFIVRRSDRVELERQAELGLFGLIPAWAKELAFGRRTYNARSETVHEKPSFRDAWRRGQRCIVPAEAIFEPCYETGKAVRWCVQQPGEVPMGVAGIYRRWRAPDGRMLWTFAMLTVNADAHPVFRRMHRPGEEKRMIVILDPAEYDRWLQCTPEEAKTFFKAWAGPLDAFPAPLPPRGGRR